MMDVKISIIIPVYNSQLILEVIQSLLAQTALNIICEILIVGKQVNPEITNSSLVRYIPNEPSTPANNRNVGAKNATSDWICFLDSDCLPAENWLERLVSPIGHGCEVIVGVVDIPNESSFWSWSNHLLGFSGQAYGLSSTTELEYATTSNFLIKKAVFDRLHGFNETFDLPAGEDREFCFRVRQEKIAIHLVQNALITHCHSRNSFISAWNHIFEYGKAFIQFRFLHPQESTYWQIASKVARIPLLGEFAGLLRVIIRGTLRPIKNKKYIKFYKYWSGVFILDFALTSGMIYTLRTYATESQRRPAKLE
jgi:glycosyltransferase involved in cell wall biosynthesis